MATEKRGPAAFLARCAFSLLLIVLALQGFYRFGFGADTLSDFRDPLININASLQYGRYLTFLAERLAWMAGFHSSAHYRLSYLLFLTVTALAATIFQDTVMSAAERWAGTFSRPLSCILRAVLCLPFISTLFTEYMMFPECFVYCFSFLFASLALRSYAGRRYVRAVLLLAASCCFYQIGVILCAIYGVLYIALDEKLLLTARSFLRALLAAAVCVCMGGLNYLATLIRYRFITDGNRPKAIASPESLAHLAKVRALLITFFRNGDGLLPIFGSNLLLLLLFAAVPLIFLIRGGRKKEAAAVLLTSVVCFALALIIPFVESRAPRITFPLYAALGVVLFFGITCCPSGRLRSSLAVIAALSLLLQIFSCQQIAVNHYISNAQDESCAVAILQKILYYEENGGETVTRIATCTDSDCGNRYDNIYYATGQINERALGLVSYTLLEYVRRTRLPDAHGPFSKVDMDPAVYAQYFEGRDWTAFNADEQLVIIGDTAYWCAF